MSSIVQEVSAGRGGEEPEREEAGLVGDGGLPLTGEGGNFVVVGVETIGNGGHLPPWRPSSGMGIVGMVDDASPGVSAQGC